MNEIKYIEKQREIKRKIAEQQAQIHEREMDIAASKKALVELDLESTELYFAQQIERQEHWDKVNK